MRCFVMCGTVKRHPFFEIVYLQDIYFFEVNTKYISSNVLKISVNSRVRSTSEIADIFRTWDEIFLVFIEKKFFKGKNRNFFPRHFSLILLGSVRLVGIILGGNTVCT